MVNTPKTTLFCALLCVWLCLSVILAQNAQERIVGGQATKISQAPYLMNLRYNGSFYCGGTLVKQKYVVTAAHCVKGKNLKSITVHGGASRLSSQSTTRRIDRAFVPRGYTKKTKNMDVAVLKLSAPMTGANIKTIGLCNTRLKTGMKIRIFGWGLTNENGTAASDIVRTVSVPVVNRAKCALDYSTRLKLTKTMFCAALNGRKDSCSGDSGGPAVVNNRLCGVVSFGLGCARTNFPGVYTLVSAVRSFINDAMKK